MAFVACTAGNTSGTADGGVGSSGSSGTSGNSGNGGNSGGPVVTSGGPTPSVNPAGSAPGEACNASSDCLIVYCDCANHSVVNSQRCINYVCTTPASACPGACSAFGTTWSGSADLEKPRKTGGGSNTSGSGGSTSSSGSSTKQPGASCNDYFECAEYTCSCLDGATASDQACIDGTCAGASTGCDSTCQNGGHGGAR